MGVSPTETFARCTCILHRTIDLEATKIRTFKTGVMQDQSVGSVARLYEARIQSRPILRHRCLRDPALLSIYINLETRRPLPTSSMLVHLLIQSSVARQWPQDTRNMTGHHAITSSPPISAFCCLNVVLNTSWLAKRQLVIPATS